MSEPKLLPCPFCGVTARLEDHRTIWTVMCNNDDCKAGVLGQRAPEPDGTETDAYWEGIMQTAVDRWNRRAKPEHGEG